MNQDQINRDLREKFDSKFQNALLQEAKRYMKVSSDYMSKYWHTWENHDQIYRGYRILDKSDKKSLAKGDTNKIIVPITYAQTQTFISFVFSTFAQRKTLFELRGRGPEDTRLSKAVEIDLDYQMEQNQYLLHLYCWLLDSCKYGFGVVKTSWGREYEYMRTSSTSFLRGPLDTVKKLFGVETEGVPTSKETIKQHLSYEGNTITNISPYSFYPDPDVPLSRFQEGAFVGHEEEMSIFSIKGLEGKLYHGTKHIEPNISSKTLDYRKRRAGRHNDVSSLNKSSFNIKNKGVILSEVEMSIIPAEWTKNFKIDFGDEQRPVKFICTMINDTKIIRFEPAGYLHNKYYYNLIEYSPDHTQFYNPGLSGTVHELQELISWFLNSHVINVKAMLKNRFIGDASKIHTEDIESMAPLIRTKTGSGGVIGDLDRVLKQLNVHDVTASHVGDIDSILKILQLVTGINENALGQFASGRRSATEARNVSAGAAARLKMHAVLAWKQGIQPNGKQMLANTRQGRSKEVYDMILGEKAQEIPFADAIYANPGKIAGCYDFVPYDATMPNERSAQANVLTEVYKATTSAMPPELLFQIMKIDPSKLLNWIVELHGINNLKDFNLDVDENGQLVNPDQVAKPEVQVLPDDQVSEVIEKFDTEKVDVTGSNMAASLAGNIRPDVNAGKGIV